MDWETLYCPNKRCKYYGIPLRQGKMVKNGSSYGQPQALCKECCSSVALSYATAYYGLESDLTIFETAVRALAEGNSIRATGRILQIVEYHLNSPVSFKVIAQPPFKKTS